MRFRNAFSTESKSECDHRDFRCSLGDLFRALGDPNGVYVTVRTPDAVTLTTFEQVVRQKLVAAIA